METNSQSLVITETTGTLQRASRLVSSFLSGKSHRTLLAYRADLETDASKSHFKIDTGTGANRKPGEIFRIESIKASMSIIAYRLEGVQIENLPAIDCITRYDLPNNLIYIDPPYLHEERSVIDRYTFEWTTKDHIDAASLLRDCSSYVVMSGYACALYRTLSGARLETPRQRGTDKQRRQAHRIGVAVSSNG